MNTSSNWETSNVTFMCTYSYLTQHNKWSKRKDFKHSDEERSAYTRVSVFLVRTHILHKDNKRVMMAYWKARTPTRNTRERKGSTGTETSSAHLSPRKCQNLPTGHLKGSRDTVRTCTGRGLYSALFLHSITQYTFTNV